MLMVFANHFYDIAWAVVVPQVRQSSFCVILLHAFIEVQSL